MTKRAHFGAVVACVALVSALVSCASDGADGSAGGSSAASNVSQAKITISPDPGKPINVTDTVNITVSSGTLTAVLFTNDAGVEVKGIRTPDNVAWKTTEPLGYDKAYTVHAEAVDSKGLATVADAQFTTVAPGNQTQVYLNTNNGGSLADGATYGVGIVVVAHFDESIPDKAKAEAAMTVTTDPPVPGAWHWFDDQNAHWRPENYYAPGTTVTVSAKLYGVDVGGGLFGQSDEQVSFKIGDAHISTADDNTKIVTVTDNGNVVREMPTSMGRGGTETVDGTTLSFWTPAGTYTVLGKSNPVVMDSSTYGLPVNSRLGYKETINWATQISGDGIYLHQLDETVWAQGNTDTSHGCLNLNQENAQWFFGFAQVGDIVKIVNTGGPPQDPANNGDWSIPWADWTRQ